MNNKHITRFGNPTSEMGAMYVVSDEEGLLQMALELEQARLFVNDITDTDILRNLAIDRVRRNFAVLLSKISSKGIPLTLTKLLSISKKTEVEKYVKQITLEEFEIFLLLQNCEKIGFTRRKVFPEFIPPRLKITKSDTDDLKRQNFLPFNKKLIQLLNFRRKIYAHLLEKDNEWHCFYFSYSEIDPEKKHFSFGAHIHYVSHLWTHDKEETWGKFETRFTKIDATHIKFKPFEYPPPLSIVRSSTPILFAIDTELPSNGNFKPIPLAQIVTRGVMSAEISIDPKSETQFRQIQNNMKNTVLNRSGQ